MPIADANGVATTVAVRYAIAVATWPEDMRLSPATARVDIVVHPPMNPTQIRGRGILVGRRISVMTVRMRPIANDPETLMTKIEVGKASARCTQ